MHRRWRGWSRRGRFGWVPPAAPAVIPPPWVPQWSDQAGWRPRWPRSQRHGRFTAPPSSLPFLGGSTFDAVSSTVFSFTLTDPGVPVGSVGFAWVTWVGTAGETPPVLAASSGAGNDWTVLYPPQTTNNMGVALLARVKRAGDSTTVTVTLTVGKFVTAAAAWYPGGGWGTVGPLFDRAGTSQATTTAPGIGLGGPGRNALLFYAERTTATGTTVSLPANIRVYLEGTGSSTDTALVADLGVPGTASGDVVATYNSASGNGAALQVELLPAGVTLVQPAPARPLRVRGVLARRGRFTAVPPAPAVAAPPVFVPQVLRQPDTARLGVRARRGAFWPTPPPALLLPSPLPRTRARVGVPARRGRFSEVPAAAVVRAPVVPAVVRAARRATLPARRGKFTPVVTVPAVVAPPAFIPQVLRLGLHPGLRRPGQFVEPPWPAVTVTPPPYPPQSLRSRLRLPWRRSGQFVEPPWPQQAVAAPSFVPAVMVGRRPQIRIIRRGRFTAAPTPVPPLPPAGPSRRRPSPWSRRGRFTQQPPPAVGLPPAPGRRRPPTLRTRRGRFAEPGWPQVIPAGPGPLAPACRSTRRRYGFRSWRGQFIEPPWPSLAQVCATPRPNTGTTAYPLASTPQPSTGTTAYDPAMTARPFTGDTEEPC